LGNAEAGSSAVVGPMPTDPVEVRKCARDLKALSAAKEHTNEERGGGRDPGIRRLGAGRGQLPVRSKIFRAAMHVFLFSVFNSSSIFNITLREESFSLPKQNSIMHSCPVLMALVT